MKKSKKVKKSVEVVKITDILCNKCGKTLCPEDIYWQEGCNIEIEFEYGSNKDGETHKFDLCDNCYDEFTNSFKYGIEKI